ncbi:MAG: cupin domain-containing protein [Paracoccaceae bacterium]
MALDHCTVEATGLGAGPFQSAGCDLDVAMTRDAADLPQTGAEQMVALLEGRARLDCSGESHELSAGEGILIPAGLTCRWQVLEQPALFYRVAAR